MSFDTVKAKSDTGSSANCRQQRLSNSEIAMDINRWTDILFPNMAGTHPPSSTNKKVQIDQVTKEFGDVVAVDDVSFTIEDREFLTLLGPSGAGKSTLLELIAGFVQPTEGEIYIDDEPISSKAPYERSIGMVFQGMALFPHMTVRDNIAFPLKMRRFDPSIIDDRVAEMLDLVELPGYEDRQPTELSGGQRQRIAIARALAFEPELLLLDEPLSSLDKKLRDTMQEELLRIHEETNVTTIHVTHNQEEALTMADRIAVVRKGTIEQLSPTQDLYSRPETPFIANFVGDSNMLNGTVNDISGEEATVKLSDGLPSTTCYASNGVSPNDTVDVALRYEDADIATDALATDNVYTAEVANSIFKGDRILYLVQLGEDEEKRFRISSARDNETEILENGEQVQVGWNKSDVMLFPH